MLASPAFRPGRNSSTKPRTASVSGTTAFEAARKTLVISESRAVKRRPIMSRALRNGLTRAWAPLRAVVRRLDVRVANRSLTSSNWAANRPPTRPRPPRVSPVTSEDASAEPRARMTGAAAARVAARTSLTSAGRPDSPSSRVSMSPLASLAKMPVVPARASVTPESIFDLPRRMPSPASVDTVSPTLRAETRTSFSDALTIASSWVPSSRANGPVSACTSMKALPSAMGSSYGFGPFFLPCDCFHGVKECLLLGVEVDLHLDAFRRGLDVVEPGRFLLRVDVGHDLAPHLVQPPGQRHPLGRVDVHDVPSALHRAEQVQHLPPGAVSSRPDGFPGQLADISDG